MIAYVLSQDSVRLIIFLTFVLLWVFGAACLAWILHLNNKTNKLGKKTSQQVVIVNKLSKETQDKVVDIDRRLRLLESKSHDNRDSSVT